MATYLDLCQEVAEESGTIPRLGDPATTAGQTGRLARICNFVTRAYNDIQRSERDWKWLQAEFSGQTIAGVRSYAASAMGINQRFANWTTRGPYGDSLFSIFLTSEGQADEGHLDQIEWHDFRLTLEIGQRATNQGKPHYMAINDARELMLYPTPDDTYTVRGRYRRGPQILSDDADIPELPEEFHEAIKWRALVRLGTFDEASEQVPSWQFAYNEVMYRIREDQLPRIQEADTFA